MLSTKEIIELYDNQEYDIIIDKLNLKSNCDTESQYILKYAISNFNIELFSHTCTINNLNNDIILLISKCEYSHSQFASMLFVDSILCDHVGRVINSSKYIYNDKFLKIIIRHISDINDIHLNNLFYNSIYYNDLETITSLIVYNFNFKLDFNQIIMAVINRNLYINIETYMFLEEHSISITPHIDKIGTLYCRQNNINGIIFCLKYGADVNYLFKTIDIYTNLSTIKFLTIHGADLNLINITNLMGRHLEIDLDIIIFLVENGIDIATHLDKLILHSINSNSIESVKYFINMVTDIHIRNELFLFFAVERCHIEIIKLLLENGADIYSRNNSILLFNKYNVQNEISEMINHMNINTAFVHDNEFTNNRLVVFKYLIKMGAMITEPHNFHRYYLHWCTIDEECLIYFLDAGLDLNKRINAKIVWNDIPMDILSTLGYMIWRNSSEMVKLLLRHGADPCGSNYDAIKVAIFKGNYAILNLILTDICITSEIEKLFERIKYE